MVDIAIITEGIANLNQIGGVSTWLNDLIGGLPNLTFSIINFLFDNKLSKKSVKIKLPNLMSFDNIFMKNYPLTLNKMEEIIEKVNYEKAMIYYATSTGCASLCSMLLSEINNKPFILTEHAIYWQEAKEANELECGLKIGQSITNELRNIAKLSYKQASIITTPTKYTRGIEIREGADSLKCGVINNGIDAFKFEFKPRYPIKNIGFVGRITRIKNIDRILKIWKILNNRNPYLSFLIIGPIVDLDYYKYLRNLTYHLNLNSKVTFIGSKGKNEWVKYIDALFLASKMETQPYVVLEALASGILPIVSNVGGLPETVSQAGLIFDLNSSDEEIASNIEKAITYQEYVEEKNLFAKNLINEFYLLNKMLNSYDKIFHLYLG